MSTLVWIAFSCSVFKCVNVYVDNEAPKCSVYGGNSSWTNGSRTIKANCEDSGSGCKVSQRSYKYDTNINTRTAGAISDRNSGIFEDNVGNKVTCPADQMVKIDKTKPTVSLSAKVGTGNYLSGSWTKNNVSVTITAKDNVNGSGVSVIKYVNDSGNTVEFDGKKLVRNHSNSCLDQQFFYKAKDKAGNWSDSKSIIIKIDKINPVHISDQIYYGTKMGNGTTHGVDTTFKDDCSGVGVRTAISRDATHSSGVLFTGNYGGRKGNIVDTLANSGRWINIYYTICDLANNCIQHSGTFYF